MQKNSTEQGLAFAKELADPNHLLSYREALGRIKDVAFTYGVKGSSEKLIDFPWPALIKNEGFYTVLTEEFVGVLAREIHGRGLAKLPSVEVCAGKGMLTKHLARLGVNITAIDSWGDDRTERTPGVEGPLTHKEALEKYKPRFVVGCWIPDVPEIGQEILAFPSVDYFLDIGEAPPNSTWLTQDYKNDNFKLKRWVQASKYAIGTTDYYHMADGNLRFQKHTEVRFWKRKGAPMSFNPLSPSGISLDT